MGIPELTGGNSLSGVADTLDPSRFSTRNTIMCPSEVFMKTGSPFSTCRLTAAAIVVLAGRRPQPPPSPLTAAAVVVLAGGRPPFLRRRFLADLFGRRRPRIGVPLQGHTESAI